MLQFIVGGQRFTALHPALWLDDADAAYHAGRLHEWAEIVLGPREADRFAGTSPGLEEYAALARAVMAVTGVAEQPWKSRRVGRRADRRALALLGGAA